MPDTDALALADRFFAAIEAGDLEAVRSAYAPDARIWHNHDGVTQTVDDNLVVLAWMASNLRDLRYEEVRRQPTPSGFVQQHVLRATLPGGGAFELPACIVIDLDGDGRITRLDEYLDSAAVAVLRRGRTG